MKQSAIRSFAFTLLILVGVGAAKTSFADEQMDHVTVTGTATSEELVLEAKRKIWLIQTDTGYYYSGAAGALHRIHDVALERNVLAEHERMPASVK